MAHREPVLRDLSSHVRCLSLPHNAMISFVWFTNSFLSGLVRLFVNVTIFLSVPDDRLQCIPSLKAQLLLDSL